MTDDKGIVLAASNWNTNADLVAACAQLNYIKLTDIVLDPTFGRGVWWKKFRPITLVTYNRNEDGSNFCDLPEPSGRFDVIAFDPPYVCVGGRKTTGMPEFHDRFGLEDTPRRPMELQELINDGLTEMYRLVRRGGYIFVKCQDYITSGKFFAGTHHTLTHGLGLGLELVDRMERIQANPRPQPGNRHGTGPITQRHSRRNLSTLFVFRKPFSANDA